jgi:hypothetical protein
MNKINVPVGHIIMVGLGMALAATLMGCVGYVGGGGYEGDGYGGAVVVPGPDFFGFGGFFEGGRDVRGYSHRGYASRSVAHSGGGRRPR